MNKVIEWKEGIANYDKYTFSIGYNQHLNRWYSVVEIFPLRTINIIGQYYTSEQNAKDSCEDFIQRNRKSK